jgi:photosystem II stability/assembly factor-like uncharacterized protein
MSEIKHQMIAAGIGKWALCFAAITLTACAPPIDASRALSLKGPEVTKVAAVPLGKLRYQIHFVDELEGWLVNKANLWRTSSGGRNWDLIYSLEASGQEITDLHFINSKAGWMLSYDGLYRTTDSGGTWTKITLPLDYPTGELRQVRFMEDMKRGWAAGGMYRPLSREDILTNAFPNNVISPNFDAVLCGAIFRTDDGGSTWSRQSLPFSVGRITDLYMADAENGVALGDVSGPLYTENGGREWRKAKFKKGCVSNAFLEFYEGRAIAATFLKPDQGWISYSDARIIKSTDRGRTWCDLLLPKDINSEGEHNGFFREIHFASSLRGWALKGDGTLHKSNDGGTTWEKVELDVDVRFDDMYFLDRHHGWAVAKEGLYLLHP